MNIKDSGDDNYLASAADREHAADRLAQGLTEGRLEFQEYEKRVSAAMVARSKSELAPLTADLPTTDSTQSKVNERKNKDTKEWINEWRYWFGGVIIMLTIWGVQSLVDGQLQNFWPIVPIGIWAAILVAVAIWPSTDDD